MVELPEGMHGVYRRGELIEKVGLAQVRRYEKTGKVRALSRGVLVDTRRLTDFRTQAAGSLLIAGADSVLSYDSALVLYGCSAADSNPIHIMLPYFRRCRNRPNMIVHQRNYDLADVTEHEGFQLSTIASALADVICVKSRRSALACADQMLSLFSDPDRSDFRLEVASILDNRRDQRGCQQALGVLELATGLAESPRESWTLLALVDAGFPIPVQQYGICDIDGREVYRLDFAWPDLYVGVEYDGYAAHEGRRQRDTIRDEDLRRRGWAIIRIDATDLDSPGRMLTAIRQEFRRRKFHC